MQRRSGLLRPLQARQAGGQERKARLQQALGAGQRIIIDLGFDDMMTEPQVQPALAAPPGWLDTAKRLHARSATTACHAAMQ